MGFSVKSFAALKAKAEAAGLHVQELTPNVQAFVTFPNDVIVEVQEDTALPTDTAFSHFHLRCPIRMPNASGISRPSAPPKASAAPEQKGAVIPSGFVDFLSAAAEAAARARKADRLLLPRFLRPPPRAAISITSDLRSRIWTRSSRSSRPTASRLDSGPTDMTKQFGLKIAFLTDPFGTRIELTEGLSKQ